jgi:hypothetical protein
MPAPSTPDQPKRAAMELASGAITRFFRCLARRAAFHPTKSGRQLKASKIIATISGYIVLCPDLFSKKSFCERWICQPRAPIVNPAIPTPEVFRSEATGALGLSKPREGDCHPLQVEEFSPADAPRVTAAVRAAAPLSLTDAAPLPPLPNIPASDVLFLKPSDPQYRDFLPAANSRTQLRPALRAVCRNEHAVAAMIDWVDSNDLTFAVRCGGHSYEGFSQSSDVVIDLRGMADIAVDKAAGLVTVGGGASLFHIYQALAAQGLALQAGSCPSASPAISWAAGTDCWRGRTA